MRFQFGLRTLLLLFLLVGFCFFIVRDGYELSEYNKVRREMPPYGVSCKHERFNEGLLFTLIANEEPIRGFEVEVRDDKNEGVFTSGFISGDSRHALKFFLRKQNREGTAAESPEGITVTLPSIFHDAEYEFIVNKFAHLGYHFFADGAGILPIVDKNRRHYTLWLKLRSKKENSDK